jgi:hypothetical protein
VFLTFRKTPSAVAFPWFETVTPKMLELKYSDRQTDSGNDVASFAHYSGILIVPAEQNVHFK